MSFKMGSSSSKSAMKKSGSSKNNLTAMTTTTTTTNKFSVLVVDDDLVIQRIHKVFLNRFGFETQVVGNGKEAVDLYRSGASFHLVLMDMEMPIMDGPKVCFFLSSFICSFLCSTVFYIDLEFSLEFIPHRSFKSPKLG